MTQPHVDIEWIVREVIRRLREEENGAVVDGDASHGKTTAPTERVAESLELSETVITLSTIKDRVRSVRQVVVPHRAVVTPAVVDELKDRHITLVRGTGDRNQYDKALKHRQRPLVVLAVEHIDVAVLAKRLGKEIDVGNRSSEEYSQVLKEVIEHIAENNLAVLLTHAPVAAVVAANRNPHARAAIAYSFPAVRQAVDEAGANLLAIDPTGRSTCEIAALINEFLRRTR